jgi:hypothetical protein
MKQYSSHLLMVRPSSFRKNEETAVNNYFQAEAGLDSKVVLQQAQSNFDAMVQQLRQARINITVFNEPEGSDTPDALFPNNWISMHHDRRVALYPMFAENRRRERREEVLDLLEEQGFEIEEVIDYSSAEEEGLYLEGTGSMITKIAWPIAHFLSEQTKISSSNFVKTSSTHPSPLTRFKR